MSSFRLLGYENREVDDEAFRDDDEDGREIGAGHTVTALYEVTLPETGSGAGGPALDRPGHGRAVGGSEHL